MRKLSNKIRAAVYNRFGDELKVENLQITEPAENELLVKLVSSGICHTDIAMRDGKSGAFPQFPIVLGHEGAGIVEKVGPGVKGFEVGDHVAMTTLYCGECGECFNGKEWLCEKNSHYLFSGKDFYDEYTLYRDEQPVNMFFAQSSFADHCVVHVNQTVKLPKDMDLNIAGPIGCGIRTGAGAVWSYLKPRPGEWVEITGAGAVGFAAMWMAKAMGAKVIMCDVVDSRLELAKQTGADVVINSAKQDPVQTILDLTNGRGADHMVEASGNGKAYLNSLKALHRGCRCAAPAVIGPLTFDQPGFYQQNNMKETHVIRMGDVAGKVIIPILCEMHAEGKFPMEKIMKFYRLDEVNKAMEEAESGIAIKPVLLFDKD